MENWQQMVMEQRWPGAVRPREADDGVGYDLASRSTCTIPPGEWVELSTGILLFPPDRGICQLKESTRCQFNKDIFMYHTTYTGDGPYEVDVMVLNLSGEEIKGKHVCLLKSTTLTYLALQ